MRTSPLPITSRRPVTASSVVSSASNRVCSLRWRALSGWFAVVVWSPSSQTSLATRADGTPEWYSSEESDEKPSSPISSS